MVSDKNELINSVAAPDNKNYLLTGYAEADISPKPGMEQTSGYLKVFHKSFHDPCKVRAAVFDDGKKQIAIAGIDAYSIPRQLVLSVRRKVQEECGIPSEAILIAASHSHSSGPIGTVFQGDYDHADPLVQSLAYEKSPNADPEYLKLVETSLIATICRAHKIREESESGAGTGIEDKVSFNRRFLMKNGMTITHPGQGNPDIVKCAGPADPEVGVIGTWNRQGKCIGCIVNFACHPTTNPGGISANYIFYLERTIRGAMGPDCIVVFLRGASGDITQVNNMSPYSNPKGEEWARIVGGRIGAEAAEVLLNMPRGTITPIDVKSKVMEIKRRPPDPERVKRCYEIVKQPPEKAGMTEWTFAKEIVMLDAIMQKKPAQQVEVQALQIGPAVFVGNPAELFCQFGLDIKNQSPFKFTFPVSSANGSVGYLPTAEAFGPNGGGYETRLTASCNLEIDAGNKITEAGVSLVNNMKPGIIPDFKPAPEFSGNPWEYGNVKPELK